MGRFFYLLRLCLLSICLAAFCVVASAEVIVDVSNGNLPYGPNVLNSQAVQLYWTQSQEFEDVSISVPLFWDNSEAFDITAYLTSTSGPGTSPPPIASASFSAPGSTAPIEALLFSGLTLDPGTYYLTLFGSQPSGPIWLGVQPSVGPSVIITAPGVTISNAFASNGGDLDANYAPASIFFLNGNLIDSGTSYQDVTVTGTVAVPEPPTWWLTVSGAAILIWFRKIWRIRA
jgi:hypothetical protein